MRCNVRLISSALVVAIACASPALAQSRGVDDQFCSRGNITDTASQLTRDWGERYNQQLVEQAAKQGFGGSGSVVRANGSEIICRITLSSVTSTVPAHRVELRDLEFRYSVPGRTLEPVTLPMTGFDAGTAITAVWERLFIDDKSYRAMLEEKAEHDPKLAAALGEIAGRPKGAENETWEPDKFCVMLTADQAAAAITDWAERTNQVRSTGLTAKETPSWLPSSNWKVTQLKAVSSIPFQSVICTAVVSYTANTANGQHVPMEIRGMPYKISGNDDGLATVETHNWPTEQESKNGDNAFNRAWVVNGRTFEQDWAAKKQQMAGQPKNVLEALAQQQAAANAQAKTILQSQGYDVDAIERAEANETNKYAASCRRSGGTWGWPTDEYGNRGRLGCYHPTGER